MEKEENKYTDMNFLKKDGTTDLKALITGLMQKFLGKALDYARISGMNDRSFTQFQRSLKDDHYMVLGFGSRILEEGGYIKVEEHDSSKSNI
jgi:hypothetical protein